MSRAESRADEEGSAKMTRPVELSRVFIRSWRNLGALCKTAPGRDYQEAVEPDITVIVGGSPSRVEGG